MIRHESLCFIVGSARAHRKLEPPRRQPYSLPASRNSPALLGIRRHVPPAAGRRSPSVTVLMIF